MPFAPATPPDHDAAPRQRRGHGRVTLRDVAAAAGVTAITVSRYLRQPGVVAPATADAIQAALSATNARLAALTARLDALERPSAQP